MYTDQDVSTLLDVVLTPLYKNLPRRRVDCFAEIFEKMLPNLGSNEDISNAIWAAAEFSGLEVSEVYRYLPTQVSQSNDEPTETTEDLPLEQQSGYSLYQSSKNQTRVFTSAEFARTKFGSTKPRGGRLRTRHVPSSNITTTTPTMNSSLPLFSPTTSNCPSPFTVPASFVPTSCFNGYEHQFLYDDAQESDELTNKSSNNIPAATVSPKEAYELLPTCLCQALLAS